MQQFRGALRRPNHPESALNTPSKELFDSDFHQDQRQKYQRSEHSYLGSRAILESKPSTTRDNKEIFDNNVPVKVKSFERDDLVTYLRVQLLLVPEKGGSALRLNLTDDSNHLFLWSFVLKESDYMSVRNQQKIKVDFSGFPEMLVQHFGFLENQKEAGNQTFFYSVFDIKKGGEATLTILESNKFKESCHLALKFKMATDQQIKNYLADKLSRQKAENEELRINNRRFEEMLEERMRKMETLSAELRQLQNDRNKELEGLSLTEQRKLQDLKEKSIQRESELVRQHEQQRKADLQQYEQTVRQLNETISQLRQKQEKLSDKVLQLTDRERQLTSQMSFKVKELSTATAQLKSLEQKSNKLMEAHMQDMTQITQLRCKNSSLQSQVDDKQAIIATNKQLKTNVNTQVQSMTEKAEEQKRRADKLEVDLERAKAQIQKFMSLAEQLKEKNQIKKEKLNMNKGIIKDQEKAVLELERGLADSKRRELDLKRDCDTLQSKINDLEARETTLKANVEQAKKSLVENSQLINHLNKQLTDRASGLKMQPGITLPYPGTRMPLGVPGMMGAPGMSAFNTETTISGSYQGTSRLRNSTSPLNANMLQKTAERINPEIRRYQPQRETSFPIEPSVRLNQQKDPDEMQQTLPTDTSSKIRPVRFRGQQPQ